MEDRSPITFCALLSIGMVALAFLVWMVCAAAAEEACDTPESAIVKLVDESPDRLVAKLEGDSLAHFISNMTSSGYLSGTLWAIDRIYIVSAKLLPGYTTPAVWIFFMEHDCLVAKIASRRDVIEELLK